MPSHGPTWNLAVEQPQAHVGFECTAECPQNESDDSAVAQERCESNRVGEGDPPARSDPRSKVIQIEGNGRRMQNKMHYRSGRPCPSKNVILFRSVKELQNNQHYQNALLPGVTPLPGQVWTSLDPFVRLPLEVSAYE